MIRFYLALSCCFLLQTGCGQVSQPAKKISATTTFSEKAYQADIQQLIDILQKNHPKLYEFISKKDFNELIHEKSSQLSDSTTIGEFVWMCRSIIASIGCGHSTVPTLGSRLFLSDRYLFPSYVQYIDNQLFVIDPLVNDSILTPGDEILSINGIKVEKLKTLLVQHISADGLNQSLKDNFINFDFMHYLPYQLGFPELYTIEYLNKEGKHQKTLTPLKVFKGRDNFLNQCQNNLCFDLDEKNSIATITIRSFYYYNNNFKKFSTFIDKCFNEINVKNIQHLIIDLRNNGGGDPYCGSYLLQHITDKPYQYYKTGTFSYADLQQLIQPHENRFKGKPYILIDGKCLSTTGQLSALIKENDVGIFVGQETGSTYTCNAAVRSFNLKYTQITPFIATRTFAAAVNSLPDDRGIIPDFVVKPTLEDLLNDKDPVTIFTKNLIFNKK